jgi:prophage regulatory protein
MPQDLLRLPQVIQRTGLSRSSIYAAVKRGEFPKSIQLGPRAVAWPSGEIDAWVQARIDAGKRQAA